jgi:hypothetical protein
MDAKATVEGVEVSTLHWIGGERVGSADAFADLSPIATTPRRPRCGRATQSWSSTTRRSRS